MVPPVRRLLFKYLLWPVFHFIIVHTHIILSCGTFLCACTLNSSNNSFAYLDMIQEPLHYISDTHLARVISQSTSNYLFSLLPSRTWGSMNVYFNLTHPLAHSATTPGSDSEKKLLIHIIEQFKKPQVLFYFNSIAMLWHIQSGKKLISA